ncbi:MAG: hypothetical protein GY839_20245 [candidate division Zixibacteria bacterium]|nr:hypothetical protein [candidate division Zixibacteria bacterium]
MDKEFGNVKITETDEGYRIDVTGKSLKEACGCGCIPMFISAKGAKMSCCEPGEEKK